MSLYSEEDVKQMRKDIEAAGAHMTERTARSLGWRLSAVAIVALTITCICVCWVMVSGIMANKDIRITEIKELRK